MVELSITVLHFNRWDLTKDCLASIDAQEIPCTYEKVLVDNGSLEPLPALPDGWQVVGYKENLGHIVGQNRCFESARGEWVLFVANDVRLQPNCIRGLWNSTVQTFPHAAQIQPALFTPMGEIDQTGMFWKWPGYGISRKLNQAGYVPIVPSSCYLMRKTVWKEVGGFDERLKTSHEDVDMGLRLYGDKIVRTNSHATHLGNATLRHQPSHTRAAFHRDRVYVIQKHYRGADRALRLAAVCLLDSLPRF